MGSLRQFRWFALKYLFDLYFKYFINLQILESGVALPRCPPWLRALWQPHSDCGLQTSAGIRDCAKFMCTSIRQFKLTNTIFNNHDNSIYLGNLYTVSIVNPVIMFIFIIYSLVFCWGNVSNSKVTWNLHNHITFITKCWGGQKILCPPLFNSWEGHVPPSLPWTRFLNCSAVHVLLSYFMFSLWTVKIKS